MDSKLLEKFRKLLFVEKQRIINNSKISILQEMNISRDDLPDETDLAATEINQSLILRLRDRERQLLNKIEQALQRIDDRSFGVCETCEEPIEPKRLEVRPVSTLCISCKEKQEHLEKVYA